MLTRNIAKSGEVLNWSGFSSFKLHLGLIVNRSQSASCHIAKRCEQLKNQKLNIMRQMKYPSILTLAIILTSCMSVKQIGKVNMISNRNIDPNLKYERISTYSGGSKKELKKSKTKTIEDAIDQTVRKVPGGEFLMNAKIYYVKDQYFAVEGDVWGKPENISYRGLEIGDKVTWKNKSLSAKLGWQKDYLTGVIKALKDDKTCLVTVAETDEVVELSYDDITKVE